MPKKVTVVAKKGGDSKKKKGSAKKPKGSFMMAIDLAPPGRMPGMGPAGPVGRRRRRMY